MKKLCGLKETVLALLEKRCADHIVDSGSGFLASSFHFMTGRVLNKYHGQINLFNMGNRHFILSLL